MRDFRDEKLSNDWVKSSFVLTVAIREGGIGEVGITEFTLPALHFSRVGFSEELSELLQTLGFRSAFGAGETHGPLTKQDHDQK
jgi:hypothetical protein